MEIFQPQVDLKLFFGHFYRICCCMQVWYNLSVAHSLPGSWKWSPLPMVEYLLGWFPSGSFMSAVCWLAWASVYSGGGWLGVVLSECSLQLLNRWLKHNAEQSGVEASAVFAVQSYYDGNKVLWFLLPNTSRGNESYFCTCSVHKERLPLHKTLWAVHTSLIYRDRATWFSALCYI